MQTLTFKRGVHPPDGKALTKDMKTGTYVVFIHKRVSIIKEATGVAFTVLTKG